MERLDTADSPHARGRILEKLAAELFGSIDGVTVVDRNRLSATGNEEVDLLLVNEQKDSGLPGFNRDVLVECKSQRTAVGAEIVARFADKLERRHLDWGVMVALAGLTGERDGWRAAVSEADTRAIQGQRMLVVVERELRGIRSGEHLAQLLEAKRVRMLSGRGLYVATVDELAALDPDPPRTGGVKFRRGMEGIRDAMRRMRRDRLGEILSELEGEDPVPLAEAIDATRRDLRILEDATEAHYQSEDDPLWLSVRAVAVMTGAAIARMLGEQIADDHFRRTTEVNVGALTHGPLRVTSGTELWRLLTDYYVRQVAEPSEQSRDASIYALLSLIVDELIAIDDIEPPYDDWPDPS